MLRLTVSKSSFPQDTFGSIIGDNVFLLKTRLEQRGTELYLIIHNVGNKKIENISVVINSSDYKLYSSETKYISSIDGNNMEKIKIGKILRNDDVSKYKVDINIKYGNLTRKQILKIKWEKYKKITIRK